MFSSVATALLIAICRLSNVSSKVPEPAEYIYSFPTFPNPLNITVDPSPEKNYFLLLGDWGCNPSESTGVKLQKGVANLMKNYVNSQKEKGMNLLFVGTVGDNFYESGQNCQYYTPRWTDIYGPVATDYNWLAVFGNHDWGSSDPHALCAWGSNDIKYTDPVTKIPYAANQINVDKGGCNPSNYYLPDFSYYYTIPELEFEYIALEPGKDCGGGQDYGDCGGQTNGCKWADKMGTASENMLRERGKNSTNRNFMIIQHYGTSGGNYVDQFKSARGNTVNDTVFAAGGHSHYQDCVRYTNEGVCDAILTGGGGHESYNMRKGFWVVGFDENKKMIQPIPWNSTQVSCFNPCGQSIGQQEVWESKLYNCCTDQDAKACETVNEFDKENCK